MPLVFVAANDSIDVNDTLVGITSDYGTVALSGDAAIPAGGALVVGPRGGRGDGQRRAVGRQSHADRPITNGLSYPFTFTFEGGGDHGGRPDLGRRDHGLIRSDGDSWCASAPDVAPNG